MNIYDYIARDQARVKGLIDELLEINLHAVQQRFFEDIKAELILHIEAKRRIVYPLLASDSQVQDIAREDAEILDLLDRLTQEALTSPKWMVLFGELKHAVEHQAAETDTRLFVPVRRVVSMQQATDLSSQMGAVKQEVMESRNLSPTHVADS